MLLGSGVPTPAEIPGGDYVLYATVEPAEMPGDLSPCLEFTGGEGSQTRLSLSETGASFQRLTSSGARDLVTWPLGGRLTRPIKLQVRSWRGDHRLSVNGVLVGQAEGLLPCGAGSVIAYPAWHLSEIRVQPLAQLSLSDDFMRDEAVLGEWEALSGSWEIATIDHPDMSVAGFTLKGSGTGSLLIGQDFWDDEVFQVSLKVTPSSKAVGLLFGWRDAQNTHLLRWSSADFGGRGRLSVVRVREGHETLLAERDGAMPLHRWLAVNIACQEGRFQACVGGVPVLTGSDPSLTGGKVGLWVQEAKVCFDDVEVRSLRPEQTLPCELDLTNRTSPSIPGRFVGDSYMRDWASGKDPWRVPYLPDAEVVDYTFHSSPVDWRPAGGEWKVFSRWICSPKFTFMGGKGEPRSIVALWHTWQFQGDHACEAFLGNDMCGRTWPHYNFGVNRCLSICADGKDPLSGYTLVWGGPDFPTRFLRKGVVFQENSEAVDLDLRDTRKRITQVLHRSWCGLRMEKEGPLIRALVDGRLLFTFEDPSPIEGGCVCLWAWDRSPMVARCRIAFSQADRPSWEELVAEEISLPKKRHFVVADRRGCLRAPITDGPVDLSKTPRLSFKAMPEDDSSLRLVVETDMGRFAAPLTGKDPLASASIPLTSDMLDPEARWQQVDINLKVALQERRPDVDRWILTRVFLEDVAGGDQIIPWLGAKPIGGWIGLKRIRFRKGHSKGTPLEPVCPGPPVLDMDPDPRWSWSSFEGSMEGWKPRGSLDAPTPFLFPRSEERGSTCLRVLNTQMGGCVGVYAPVPPYDLSKYPWIAFHARMGERTNINLLLKIHGVWEEMVITGLKSDRNPMGSVVGASRDTAWHACYANVWEAYKASRKPCRAPTVKSVAFGDTGLWSHVKGDSYDLDQFEIVAEHPVNRPMTLRATAEGAVQYQGMLRDLTRGEEREWLPDRTGRFVLLGLEPGPYAFEVVGINEEGLPGPKSVTHLFLREPWEDREAPRLSDLAPPADSQCGDKQIRFVLSDEGSGVDLCSVRLQVMDKTYSLAGKELEVDPCAAEWLWNGNGPQYDVPEGPVPCRLCFADLSGNNGELEWTWHFQSSLDKEAPVLGHLTLIPSPHFVFQGFEEGTDGWQDFDNVIVDWGAYGGASDAHAIEYIQDSASDWYSAQTNIAPVSAREWPLLRMDVRFFSGEKPGVIARVHNTDKMLPFKGKLLKGEWQTLVLDLEAGLAKAKQEDPALPVSLLAFLLRKPGRLWIDNVCLYGRSPERVKVTWAVPPDATGISGYRYRVDELPEGPAEPGKRITESAVEVQLEGKTRLYFHLQASDGAGNWSPVVHKRLTDLQ